MNSLLEKNKKIKPNVIRELKTRIEKIEAIIPDINQFLLRNQSKLKVQSKENKNDLVTNADIQIEKKIIAFIKKNFPHDGIIAEESGIHPNSQKNFCWVIDPIDGTTNYVYNLPLFSVSIGLMYESYPRAGLISLPALNHLYKALPGKATKNNKAIQVSKESSLANSMVVTGLPYHIEDKVDAMLAIMKTIISQTRGLRRTGSAAVDLAWVAEGLFGVHFEMGLRPWDICAGIALIEAAGGKVTCFKNLPYHLQSIQVLATNSLLHPQFLKILSNFS